MVGNALLFSLSSEIRMLLDPVPDYDEAGPIERHGLMAKLADQLHLRLSRTRQKSPS
jgi:hypothetical protein